MFTCMDFNSVVWISASYVSISLVWAEASDVDLRKECYNNFSDNEWPNGNIELNQYESVSNFSFIQQDEISTLPRTTSWNIVQTNRSPSLARVTDGLYLELFVAGCCPDIKVFSRVIFFKLFKSSIPHFQFHITVPTQYQKSAWEWPAPNTRRGYKQGGLFFVNTGSVVREEWTQSELRLVWVRLVHNPALLRQLRTPLNTTTLSAKWKLQKDNWDPYWGEHGIKGWSHTCNTII